MIVETFQEPIRGWRAWRVYRIATLRNGMEPRLCAVGTRGVPKVWEPNRPTLAVCSEHEGLHEAPDPACECGCGIYALRSRHRLDDLVADWIDNFQGGPEVIGWALGQVNLWGRVSEFELGWRGERAYPYAITVHTNDQAVVRELRSLYLVDVDEAPALEAAPDERDGSAMPLAIHRSLRVRSPHEIKLELRSLFSRRGQLLATAAELAWKLSEGPGRLPLEPDAEERIVELAREGEEEGLFSEYSRDGLRAWGLADVDEEDVRGWSRCYGDREPAWRSIPWEVERKPQAAPAALGRVLDRTGATCATARDVAEELVTGDPALPIRRSSGATAGTMLRQASLRGEVVKVTSGRSRVAWTLSTRLESLPAGWGPAENPHAALERDVLAGVRAAVEVRGGEHVEIGEVMDAMRRDRDDRAEKGRVAQALHRLFERDEIQRFPENGKWRVALAADHDYETARA